MLNCSVDVTVANAGMFEEYFENLSLNDQKKLATTFPSWVVMSYQSPFVEPSPWGGPISKKTHSTLTALHAAAGNYKTEGKTLIWGSGSTQVIRSLMVAASARAKKSLWLYAKPPYYPTFRAWCAEDSFDSCLGVTNRTDLNPSDVVELVTWPNNPDGEMYAAVYPNASLVIHDLVYYWQSSFRNATTVLDLDAAVFSMSKMTGHASSRFGWGWVRDPGLAYGTIGFFSTETYQSSTDGILRCLKIAQSLPDGSFFSYARASFDKKWAQLEALSWPLDFRLKSVPGTWFAWISCGNRCDAFEKHGIDGVYQNGETGVYNHIRLNLNLRASDWELLMQRLAQLFAS